MRCIALLGLMAMLAGAAVAQEAEPRRLRDWQMTCADVRLLSERQCRITSGRGTHQVPIAIELTKTPGGWRGPRVVTLWQPLPGSSPPSYRVDQNPVLAQRSYHPASLAHELLISQMLSGRTLRFQRSRDGTIEQFQVDLDGFREAYAAMMEDAGARGYRIPQPAFPRLPSIP